MVPPLRLVFYLVILAVSCDGGLWEKAKEKFSRKKSPPEGAFALTEGGTRRHLSPVIILPGDGGSPLEAKLDKPSVLNRLCPSKTKGWDRVWADMDILIPALVDCWVDNLRLVYNNVTRSTFNSPGVQTRVPGFGGTKTIEYLTSKPLPSYLSEECIQAIEYARAPIDHAQRRRSLPRYMADLVEALAAHGYQRGVNIRGAPYDFRKTQNEQGQYFVALKALVEDTYELNHKTPVTFIAHSLGCLYLLYFLNRQTQDWKDKYVSSFMGLGGPWGGAVKPLKVIASGDDLGISIVSHSRMRDVLRTNPSVAALFPTDKFWRRDETLLATADRVYTLNNLKDFFHDVNYSQGWEFYQDTQKLVYDLSPPRVKMHCISGTGIDTPKSYLYRNNGVPSGRPSVVVEDGDGTVNRRSLDGCKLWADQQNETVIDVTFQGAGHLKMIRHPAVLSYIQTVLLS